jgi:hypothetical protein
MGPPSIINQHMSGEPVVNNIPPPKVEVHNQSPGVVNVHISVSPAISQALRNPGATPQSGAMNDAGASKTGAVGQ